MRVNEVSYTRTQHNVMFLPRTRANPESNALGNHESVTATPKNNYVTLKLKAKHAMRRKVQDYKLINVTMNV